MLVAGLSGCSNFMASAAVGWSDKGFTSKQVQESSTEEQEGVEA